MLRIDRKGIGYKMETSIFLGEGVDCISLYCVFDTSAIVLVLQLWDRVTIHRTQTLLWLKLPPENSSFDPSPL